MKQITFNNVQKWIRAAKKPLEDEKLETFQEEYFSDFRHEYYRFFYYMVAEMKPAVALEIGVEHGHCAVHMAAGHRYTKVLGLDKRVDCVADSIPIYDNCEFIYEDSLISGEEAIKKFVRFHGPIGIVFQDSSHHYEASRREFEIYSQFLDKNAIWCADDIREDFHDPLIDSPGKSMVSYWDELPGRKKLYENLHHGTVIGVALL